MPDFDIDFCMDRRDEVIAYVRRSTARERRPDRDVRGAQGKSVIKDVARCIGITSPVEAQQIANLIPARPRPRRTRSPRPRARAEAQGELRHRAAHPELLDQARKLEGLTRHAGKHAAGSSSARGRCGTTCPSSDDEKSGALRHAVLQGRRRAGGARQVRLPRPEDADGARRSRCASSTRGPTPFARRKSSTSPPSPGRQAHLPAARLRRDQGGVPARVERHAAALQGPEGRLLRGHRRRRRPLPPGPARQRDGRGLREAQERPAADRRCTRRSTTSSRRPTASSSTRSR
jgi:hypothetical protein